MSALLIPITLDALMVRAGQTESWAVTKMAEPATTGTTRRRQRLAPDTFQTLAPGRPPGAYLHWALPDALGHGLPNDDGTTTFPPVPNRWIVLRLSGAATPGPRRVDGWMLPDISTAAPVTVGGFLDSAVPGPGPAPAQPLTILGHGDASWAAYFDNVLGRLAFYDDLSTAGTGPVAYLVCGWYLDPALDPLPRTTETALRAYLQRQNWQVDLPAGQPLPTQSLFHGCAVSIGWPDVHWPGDGGQLGDEPDLRPASDNVQVAAGVTLADALAVFAASPGDVAFARLMTGLLSGAIGQLTSADGPARLDTVLHADRFGSVPSTGTTEAVWEPAVTGANAGRFQPVRTAAPRAWHPVDPTLLLRGAGRSFRHGGDGRFADTGALDLRLEGSTVTAFGVAGGNPGDGASVLPADRLAALTARTPSACAALLIELAALDPGSAPDLAQATATQPSPVAAIRAAWWATWDPATGTGPIAGAVIAGSLPSPLSVSPPARPWTPVHLEWRADYFPSLRGRYDWELSDLDYEFGPDGQLAGQPSHHVGGRILLTPAGAAVAADVERAERESDRLAGAAPDSPSDVDTLAGQDLLSGSLDHLSEQLRGDSTDAVVQAPGAPAVPLPVTPLTDDFVGLRAGALSLTALRVVDGYGRTLDLPPQPRTSTDAGFPPQPGRLGLPPRFTAPARVLLRYTDATGVQVDADAGRSPVCGYLVPSPVDGTLEFFSADATGLGRLRPDPVTGAAWEPDPGQPAAAGIRPGADIANPYLAAIAESMLDADRTAALGGATATQTVLRGVQEVIDTTQWTVDLTGRTGDEHLALLLGAPVAVLRAAILLEVDDPRQPPGLAATAVPVKLGTLAHQQDGLLGYYVGDDYTRLHVVDPAIIDAVDGVFAGAYLTDPTFTVQPGTPVTLTLLAVPNSDVHVTTGLVPQKSIGQLREWTAPALSRLSPALRFGPVLRDPATTRLPFPSDIRGTWTWHRRPDPLSWASDPVVRATGDAVLAPALPEASDGWLQVALVPDNLYRDTATRIGIASVRTRRGPHGTRGEILAVGITDPAGRRTLLTVAEAARLQESGRFAFHAAPTGAEVHVITNAGGAKTLSTSANPSDPNGLTVLPEATGTVDRLAPATAAQGQSVHLILTGEGLAGVTDVTFTDPGIELTSIIAGETFVDLAVTIDADATPGPQTLTLFTADGTVDTSRVSFAVVAAPTAVTRWTAGTKSTNWSDARNWSAGVPVESSIVIVDTASTVLAPLGTVRLQGLILDATATVQFTALTTSFLELHGQSVLTTSATTTVTDAFTWTGGSYGGTMQVGPRSATRIDGTDAKQLLSGRLSMHGAATWAGSGALTLSAPMVLDGLLVVEGAATLAGGSQLRNWGTVATASGGSLTFNGARLENNGIVRLSGGSVLFQRDQHTWHDGGSFAGVGSVQVTGSATIFGDGRVTVDPGVSIQLAAGSLNGTLIVEGGGTLHWTGGTIACTLLEMRPGCPSIVDGTGTKTVTGLLLNRDHLTWTAGPLQLNGTGLTNEGRFDIEGAAVLTGTGTLLNNGTVAVAGGGSLGLAGPFLDHVGVLELDGGATVDLQQSAHHWRDRSRLTGTGTIQVHAPATVTGEGHVAAEPGVAIRLVTGTVGGSFVVDGGTTVTWLGGTIGSGSLELRPGCPLVIDGTATKTLAATLAVRDTTTLTGGGTLQVDGVLVNEGRLSVEATTTLTGTGSMTNSGTLTLASGVNLTMSGPSMTHTSTMELAGGTIDLAGGAHTWSGTSRLTGTGTVQIHTPATLTSSIGNAAATIAPGVTVQLVTGTINGPFVVQGGGTLAWLGGTIAGKGTVEARADCPVLIDGTAARTLSTTCIIRGATTWRGGATVQLTGVTGVLLNHGALQLLDSTQLTGNGTLGSIGTITLADNVNLTMAGPVLDNAGTVQLAGGTLALQANAHFWRDRSILGGTGTVTITAGSVTADGRVTVAAGVGVQLAGASLAGTVAFTGGGTFTWTGGTISSTLDVRPECPVVIDGTAAKSLTGSLVVRGATTWRGGGAVQLSGPLTNEGTLTIQASTQCTGASTLNNKGTIALADSVNLTMAGAGLTQSGTLRLAGGTLALQSGTHHLIDGCQLAGTGTVQLRDPATLSLDSHLPLASGVTFQVTGGTLSGVCAIEGGGTVGWSGGTISSTGLEVLADCPVVISGTATKTITGTLLLRGTTTWTDGGTITVASGGLVNEGNLTVQASAQCSGAGGFTNKGSLTLADGVNLTVSGTGLTQAGQLTLAGGTVNLQNGVHHLNEGSRVAGTGTVQLHDPGTLSANTHLAIAPGITVQVVNGTLTGTAAIEGGGTLVWSGGTFNGAFDVGPDCAMVINGTATKTVTGSLVLRGTTTWTDGGTLQVTSTLINEGVLTVKTTAQITGSNTFTNNGTVALADGVDLTLGGSVLDLFGTVHLSGGTLNLPGHQHSWHEGAALLGAGEVALTGNASLNGSGRLTVEPGVGIVLNTAALNATGSIEGGGTVQVIAGSLGGGALEIRSDCVVVIDGTATKTVNGTVTLRGTTSWSESGILQIIGTLINEGSFTIQNDGQCTGTGTLTNKGTIALTDGVNLVLNGPALDHSGVIALAGGVIDLKKSAVHAWRNAAAFAGTGTLQVHTPAAVTAGGHLSAAPGVTVQLVSGAISGTLVVEGGGAFTWLGGSLGPAEFRTGTPVLFDSSATKTLTGDLVLRGDTIWTGGGNLAMSGHVLTNTGRLTIQASAQCSGSGTVNNQGTIALNPAAVYTVDGGLLSNTGALELGTGTLHLGAGTHNLLGRSEVDVDLVATGQFGQITCTGNINLAGTLAVNPSGTDPFTVVTAQSVQGTFTEVDSTQGPYSATYAATTVTVQPTPQLVRAVPGPTIFDLNGRWLPAPGPVITVTGLTITVDMSAFGRPTATGTILGPSTIRVTFPDAGILTGLLQSDPDRINWSNNAVWTKV
jgi:hypothetical protein